MSLRAHIDPAVGVADLWPIPAVDDAYVSDALARGIAGRAKEPHIFQIWFGARGDTFRADYVAGWRALAARRGLVYRLVGALAELADLRAVYPAHFALLDELERLGKVYLMSDIVRLLLLFHYGGLYVDADMRVPRDERVLALVFDQPFPVVVPESDARNVGSRNAVFACNGFIAAQARSAFVARPLEHVVASVRDFFARTGHYDAMFCTGPYFVNRMSTHAPVLVLPFPLMGDLGLFPEVRRADASAVAVAAAATNSDPTVDSEAAAEAADADAAQCAAAAAELDAAQRRDAAAVADDEHDDAIEFVA